MKIYKRKYSTLIKSYLLNILASFIFLILISNFIELLFGLIATFFLYSYLMYTTFVKERTYFVIEGNSFYKMRGKNKLFEFDRKKYKVKKELKKGVVGYSEMNLVFGNQYVDCSMLDLKTFEQLAIDINK